MKSARTHLVVVAALLASSPVLAVAQGDDKVADRLMATRQELKAAEERLGAKGSTSQVLARIRSRLTDGDFQRGDRIVLEVQSESTLTDTFTVSARQELRLPQPTTGAMSLTGVLRSELEEKVTAYIARFRQNPVVRAYPLIRLSVQGEVANGGVYAVPVDGRLADAVMAAGGTTQFAKANKIAIERNGDKIWQGSTMEAYIDDLGLKDGDQIVIGSDRPGKTADNLRFIALIVSIAGGLYGLSRAF